jgi:hypothetical protein
MQELETTTDLFSTQYERWRSAKDHKQTVARPTLEFLYPNTALLDFGNHNE